MTPDELGPTLRFLRERRCLAQAVVARRAGVTPAMLSSYELGKRLPSVRSLLRVLKAMDLELTHLDQAREVIRQEAVSYRRLEELGAH